MMGQVGEDAEHLPFYRQPILIIYEKEYYENSTIDLVVEFFYPLRRERY